MACEVRTTDRFEKESKRLIKKYPSLLKELRLLGESLSLNPKQGTSLGNNLFKLRLAIKSKGSGKSGGARVITNLIVRKNVEQDDRLYLLSIYEKSERSTISTDELKRMAIEILGGQSRK